MSSWCKGRTLQAAAASCDESAAMARLAKAKGPAVLGPTASTHLAASGGARQPLRRPLNLQLLLDRLQRSRRRQLMNTLGRSAAHATSLRAAVHKLPGPTDWCCRGQASLMSASLLLQSAAHLNARPQQLRANRKLTRARSSCCGCCLCLAQGSLEGGGGGAGLGKGFIQTRRCLHGGALR